MKKTKGQAVQNTYTKISLTLLLLLQSMPIAASLMVEECSKAITEWPDYLYGEAFPGASFPKAISKEELFQYQEQAYSMTLQRAKSNALDETTCVGLDWVFALLQAQKELLRKPIEEWTVQDICNISSWLTRLTAKHPGKFRTEPVLWNLRELSPDEELKLAAIEANNSAPLSDKDKKFLESYCYHFIRHEDIEKALNDTLEFIKNELRAALELPLKDRIHRYLGIGSSAHFKIVQIHPFEEGSKRLGRLIMYIIWAQRGLEPVPFFDLTYTESLISALTQRHTIFLSYVAQRFYLCQVLRSCPFYYEILNDILKKRNHEKVDFKSTFLNHPLFQAYMKEKNSSSQQALSAKPATPSDSSVKKCHYCKKVSTPEQPCKKCSRCKNVVYCSKECQVSDWKESHKQQCVNMIHY